MVHWITTHRQRGYAPRYRTVEIIRNRCVIGVNDEDIQLVNYNEFGKYWGVGLCHVILNLKVPEGNELKR